MPYYSEFFVNVFVIREIRICSFTIMSSLELKLYVSIVFIKKCLLESMVSDVLQNL